MIKKALLLLVAVIALAVPTLSAQQKTGRWTVYPTVSTSFDAVAETPDKAYFLTAGNLFHYSFDDNEFYAYNVSNKLSDSSTAKIIKYNPAGKYLCVAYSGGNIDLLYDNGKVVNMPDIKEAVLSSGREINNVEFVDGRIYVAAQFGFAIFDEKAHEVVESGIFDKDVSNVFPMGDQLVVIASKRVYHSPLTARHTSLENFTDRTILYATQVERLSDTKMLYVFQGNNDGSMVGALYTYEPLFDAERGDVTSLKTTAVGGVIPTNNGYFATTATEYALIDTDATVSTTTIPDALKGATAFSPAADVASMWVASADGIARYDLSDATPTMLIQPFLPEGFSVSMPAYMKYSADGRRLYVANTGATYYYGSATDGWNKPQQMDIVEDGIIRDAAVFNARQYTSVFPNNKDFHFADDRVASCSRFVEDPDDPSIYYVASNSCGIMVVQDNKLIQVIGKDNSPIPSFWWFTRSMDVKIDNDGNLWFAIGYGGQDYNYWILPAAKRRDIKNVTKNDWVRPLPAIIRSGQKIDRDVVSMFTSDGTFIVFYGSQADGFTFYNTNGTLNTTSDDRTANYLTVTDTEGNNNVYPFIRSIVQDKDGLLWFGTNQGLFTVSDIDAALAGNMVVKRPIVPRNDGTNFGDYLCESENIFEIDVDPSNRKWIATAESGVYLVSADGTQILEHYTTNNSMLPSNTVYSLACDPLSNKVYFGTAAGVVSYESDSSPAADDYSEVLVYPNPVRPDFGGWITISGLMDNSLVKIADVAGNVFFQGRSEGGMVRWDGCTPDGQRVRTGVYLVMASSGSSSSMGTVAKIMVVN